MSCFGKKTINSLVSALAISLAALCACGGSANATGRASTADEKAVEFAYILGDRHIYDVADLRGDVLVLWAFASFDRNSLMMLETIESIARDTPAVGILVQPTPRRALAAFIATADPEFRVGIAASDDDIDRILGEVRTVPTLIILDAGGRVRSYLRGRVSEDLIRDRIAAARKHGKYHEKPKRLLGKKQPLSFVLDITNPQG